MPNPSMGTSPSEAWLERDCVAGVFVCGRGKYLVTPLAVSVAFAMFASYVLSRTLTPVYCALFLKAEQFEERGKGRRWRISPAGAERRFEWLSARYVRLLES